ncbi:hypothetical protein [Halovenus halobia]|uniref:hypothetical protein n=1 Tax=Halovenus halobia TaxID=3396622 RepID=UPI003F54332D
MWVIADICGENCIESVEILIYPGPDGLVFVLHPRPYALDGRSDTQSKLDTFDKKLHKPALNKLKQSVKRRYPSTVTAEIGWLDLEPIGISDVTTTRLYLKEDGYVPPEGNVEPGPLDTLFEALEKGNDPFIYQVIVDGGDGTYNVTARLATYHPRDNYTGDRGFAQLVEQGKPTDPARVFRPFNIGSNHDSSLAELHWNTTYDESVSGAPTYEATYNYKAVSKYKTRAQTRHEADLIKEIILGHKEHQRLLNGDTYVEPILKDEFGWYGRFSVPESRLKPFVSTVTRRWTTNAWIAIEGRSAPVFHSRDDIEVEDPAKFGLGDDEEERPWPNSGVENDGAAGHIGLEKYAYKTFLEGGDSITKVEQTTEELPDQRIESEDGEIKTLGKQLPPGVIPVELESKNVTKAANTLKNAARAYAADRHVIFVYRKEDVETGYEHLREPVKQRLERGVILYNGTGPVKALDGRQLVRRGSGSTTYILEGTTIIAEDDAGELARGPADEDVGTYDWGTDEDATQCGYYYETDEGTHRVETAEGDLIEEYSEKKTFRADWTQIREPHVPVALNYLDFATVTYRDTETNQLRVYDPDPEWETNDRGESRQGGFDTFFDRLIVERDGPDLTYEKLEDAFATWFGGRSQFDPPVRSVLGQLLPEDFADAKKGATGNDYKYFAGYDLLFTPTSDSPHQPGPPADFDETDGNSDDSTSTDE